jgi:hypothetical protein
MRLLFSSSFMSCSRHFQIYRSHSCNRISLFFYRTARLRISVYRHSKLSCSYSLKRRSASSETKSFKSEISRLCSSHSLYCSFSFLYCCLYLSKFVSFSSISCIDCFEIVMDLVGWSMFYLFCECWLRFSLYCNISSTCDASALNAAKFWLLLLSSLVVFPF